MNNGFCHRTWDGDDLSIGCKGSRKKGDIEKNDVKRLENPLFWLQFHRILYKNLIFAPIF